MSIDVPETASIAMVEVVRAPERRVVSAPCGHTTDHDAQGAFAQRARGRRIAGFPTDIIVLQTGRTRHGSLPRTAACHPCPLPIALQRDHHHVGREVQRITSQSVICRGANSQSDSRPPQSPAGSRRSPTTEHYALCRQSCDNTLTSTPALLLDCTRNKPLDEVPPH